MSIIDRLSLKKTKSSRDFKLALDLILAKINSEKSSSAPDAFFNILGEELNKLSINSAVLIYNDQKTHFIVKYYKSSDKLNVPIGSNLLIKANAISEIEKKSISKKPIFFHKADKLIGEIFTFSEKESVHKHNLILVPLTIHNDIIGYLCVFSNFLNKKNIDALYRFGQNLLNSLTDKILYREIRETEEKYKELWNEAPIAYYSLDKNGVIKKVNNAGLKLLGYAEEEMIGKSIISFILPEQQDEARSRFNLKLRGITPLKKKDRTYVKKDGSRIYVSSKDSLIKNNLNEVIGVNTTILDYTHRRAVEKALKASEEKYRKLVDNAEDGLIILDINGFLTFANNSFTKITGYTVDDLRSLVFIKLIYSEDQERVKNIFKKKINNISTPTTHEYRLLTKDSRLLHISCSSVAIKEKSKVIGIQAILRDITENKLLTEKIKESQKHYEQVINTIQNGICVINKRHVIVSCNKTFQEKIGLPIDKIIGSFCSDIIPRYDNMALKNHCIKGSTDKTCSIKTVFKTGEVLIFTEENKNNFGKNIFHRFYIFPSKNEQNETYQIVMTINDITEQKIAELEYTRLSEFNKRILDSAPISIVALDKNGMVASANRMAKVLMDKPDNPITKQHLVDTPEIKDNKKLLSLYHKLLKNGESFYYDNLSYVPEATKTKKHLNVIAVPLYAPDNSLDGAISMAIDNTEAREAKKRLEDLNKNLEIKVLERTKQLDDINKKLREAIDLKSKFIADASHELRTPLTVIQGNLDLAIREAAGLKIKHSETYDLIINEVSRMTSVLSDLTMLTNTDSGNEKLHYEKINLAKLIKAACQSLMVLAEQKKISLIYKKESRCVQIVGDEGKLEKLLLNIIRNAIKYTDSKGKIKIWVEDDEHYVKIHIQDNGIGIPKEDLPYIFERFYRVDKSRSRMEGGTGLGLSICKWVAEAHGGFIGVESKLGEGTTFTVHLPCDYDKNVTLGI